MHIKKKAKDLKNENPSSRATPLATFSKGRSYPRETNISFLSIHEITGTNAHTGQSEQDVARAAGCLGERMHPRCVRTVRTMLIIRIVRGHESAAVSYTDYAEQQTSAFKENASLMVFKINC